MDDKPVNQETTGRLEILFLRIFKNVLLIIMTLSLLVALGFTVLAAINFFQTPKPPKPAAEPPKQEVDVDKLLKELSPPDKAGRDGSRGVDGERSSTERPKEPAALKYLEETTKLYRCSSEFTKSVGASVEENDAIAGQQQIENLRSNIESVADGNPTRGNAYVQDAVRFTCSALANQKLVDLYKEKKEIKGVFLKTLRFHLREWDRIQEETARFKSDEVSRVAREREEEAARVATARAEAIAYLTIAGATFAVFMALALYLIFARIEANLRDLSVLRSMKVH